MKKKGLKQMCCDKTMYDSLEKKASKGKINSCFARCVHIFLSICCGAAFVT